MVKKKGSSLTFSAQGGRGKEKILKPAQKIRQLESEDGSAGGVQGEECRAVRAWKPRRSARTLGGRNRAEISLSFFEFFSGGARKRKIVRENFCEVAAGALAEAGGGAGAYDLVQSHHALRACVSRGSAQRKFGFRPKGTANLQFQHFGERLPRRVAPRQARFARQSPILRGFATLRVAKRKRLGFGFGSSFWRSQSKTKFCNQSFLFRLWRNLEAIIFNILTV